MQLQGALHCLMSALPHQSSLLSLKNVWTSECSQVLQSLQTRPACSAADAAAPGVPRLHRRLQSCRPNIRGRPAEQSGLSGSTCLMEPAILSGSNHYPALQPTPSLNNDQEKKIFLVLCLENLAFLNNYQNIDKINSLFFAPCSGLVGAL